MGMPVSAACSLPSWQATTYSIADCEDERRL